jgi:spore germination protein GerM
MKRKVKLAIMRRSAGVLVAATVGFLGLAAVGAYWAQTMFLASTPSPSVSAVMRHRVAMRTIKAYFGNVNLNPQSLDCQAVFPVEREVPATVDPIRAAIGELLAGPSLAERNGGYYSSLNTGVRLNSINIIEGIVVADFNFQLDEGVGGSCRVSAIRSQIERTLMQFSNVRAVVISVDGRTADVLQP